MESRVTRGYLDLLVALGWVLLAAGATALSLDGIVRLVLLVPTTVFLPGYAVVSLAYPTVGLPPDESTIGPSGTGLRKAFSRGNHAIGGVERIALAVLWSLVVVPGIALAVHFSPYPIAARPIQIGVFGVTVALLVGAVASRARRPPDERFVPSIPSLPEQSSPGLGSGSASRSGSRILLAVSLLVLASSVGYAFVAPPQDDGFTELYVQSDDVTDGTTSLYPSTLVRGQSQPLDFAVTNREGAPTEYGYAVALQRIDRGGSRVDVVAETEVDRGEFELAAGATRNLTAQVTPRTAGDDFRLVVLVYRDGLPSNPRTDDAYRSLRLPVNVTSGGEADSSAHRAPRGDN